jgi:putative FmdB family regulatory protein
MPAYDYHCARCGGFEVQRRMSDPPLESCPNCSGPVERVISRNVNFLFKGSGFYITDYRGDSYKKDAAADSAATAKASEAKAPEPAKAAPGGPEAKPAAPAAAAKPEAKPASGPAA